MTDKEKIVYDILCSEEQPPEGQHWEGFVASKIAAALAQPVQPMSWVALNKEADEIVRGKVLWKRHIDGTPLSNDIACWMADFAEEKLKGRTHD